MSADFPFHWRGGTAGPLLEAAGAGGGALTITIGAASGTPAGGIALSCSGPSRGIRFLPLTAVLLADGTETDAEGAGAGTDAAGTARPMTGTGATWIGAGAGGGAAGGAATACPVLVFRRFSTGAVMGPSYSARPGLFGMLHR